MKVLVGLIASVIVFMIVYPVLYTIGGIHEGVSIIIGLISAVSIFAMIIKNMTIKEVMSSIVSYSKEVSEGTKIDDRFYAVAEQEIDRGNIDAGLWSKALVYAKGNETVRKAEYIKLRARQLHKQTTSTQQAQQETVPSEPEQKTTKSTTPSNNRSRNEILIFIGIMFALFVVVLMICGFFDSFFLKILLSGSVEQQQDPLPKNFKLGTYSRCENESKQIFITKSECEKELTYNDSKWLSFEADFTGDLGYPNFIIEAFRNSGVDKSSGEKFSWRVKGKFIIIDYPDIARTEIINIISEGFFEVNRVGSSSDDNEYYVWRYYSRK